MILDKIENREIYTQISPLIKAGLEHIANTDFAAKEPGRYELQGNDLYVLVQKYETVPKEQGKWECHQKYIDIQYIAKGVEQIGYANVEQMSVKTEYNPEKDICILDGKGDYLTLTEGSYGIFFPADAHQPKVAPDNITGQVTKVVVKVRLD